MNGAARSAAVLLLSVAAAVPALGAKLPDWARSVADAAPPVPEGVPEDPTRVLLLETRLEIEPAGTVRVRHRRVVQALSARSEGVGIGSFHVGGERKLERSTAWHVAPGERAEKSKDALEVTIGDSFLTDAKARLMEIPGVKRGSVVAYEFLALETPWVLTHRQSFYDADGPVSVARVEVVAPPGWTVRHDWLHGEGPEPVTIPGGWAWESRDIPTVEDDETMAPAAFESALTLVLGFVPPADGRRPVVAAPETWADLARWYIKIAKGRADPAPEVAQACATAGAETGEFASKVLAAARHVRDGVRHISRDVGIGGYQPRPALKTARELIGDCKDKATLLQAMLGAVGIASHPILVHATERGTVSRTIPDLEAFNHLVLGVEIPEGAALPAWWSAATIEAAPYGKLLVVDTTDEYASIGSLPVGLSGKTVLLIEAEGGRLIDLPEHAPSTHRVERSVTVSHGDDGSWRVIDRRVGAGEIAERSRVSHRSDPTSRRRARERSVRDRWPDSSVEAYEVHPETAEGTFDDRLAFRVPSLAGGTPFAPFFAVADEMPRVSLRRRKSPVDFGHPFQVVVEAEVPGWADGVPLPEGRHETGDGWSVESRFEASGGALHGRIDVSVQRARFATEAFPELKRLFEAVAAAASVPMAIAGSR